MELSALRFSEIPVEGVQLDCQVCPEEIGVTPADTSVEGMLSLQVNLHAMEDVCSLHGVLSGTVLRKCVRCLEDFREEVALPIVAEYQTQTGRETLSAKKLPKEETLAIQEEKGLSKEDGYYFDGDTIDLAPMLREQVILANPIQPLCHGDCRGLCVRCGQNLNVVDCGCVEDPFPNPFRVLQSLRDRKESSTRSSSPSPKFKRPSIRNDE